MIASMGCARWTLISCDGPYIWMVTDVWEGVKKKKTLFLIFINYTDYSVWAYEIWTHQSKMELQFIHAHHGRTRKCIGSVTWFGKVRPNIAKVNPISPSKKGPMTMMCSSGTHSHIHIHDRIQSPAGTFLDHVNKEKWPSVFS